MKIIALIIGFLFTVVSCSDLEVINEMEPDSSRAFDEVSDYMKVAEGTFKILNNTLHEYSSLASPMAIMADYHTSSWGNARDYGYEPRFLISEYYNSPEYAYSYQINDQWNGSYQVINLANLVLKWIYDYQPAELEESQRALMESFCLFTSGLAHGYLGLVFDQAVIVEYNSGQGINLPVEWDSVVEKSLELLDKAIEVAESESFTVPGEWLAGNDMSNIELSQLINSYAARILLSSSRTQIQNAAIDWQRVLQYAQNGMVDDFAPELGDTYDWIDLYWVYGTYYGWSRVDMRIVNLMDHDYPSHWPRDNTSWNTPTGQDPGPAIPEDARLLTDFQYLESNNYPPSRGYYNFSHYRHSRYDYLRNEVWYGKGRKPYFLAWELRLIEAEALLRTGNVSGAVAILNDPAGPRKVRGGLPDIDPAVDDVLRLILDEKDIECYNTGAGVPYFDMRRTDRLQPGTWLHFPIPAKELIMLNLPVYTIYTLSDGINGSAGDWTGWDE